MDQVIFLDTTNRATLIFFLFGSILKHYSQVAQIFTKQSERNKGHTMH